MAIAHLLWAIAYKAIANIENANTINSREKFVIIRDRLFGKA
jgi:hypothetical protein